MLEFFYSENWGSEKPFRFWEGGGLKIEKDYLHKMPATMSPILKKTIIFITT